MKMLVLGLFTAIITLTSFSLVGYEYSNIGDQQRLERIREEERRENQRDEARMQQQRQEDRRRIEDLRESQRRDQRN